MPIIRHGSRAGRPRIGFTAVAASPAPATAPVAVTDGSRTRKVNKTRVRLWSDCPCLRMERSVQDVRATTHLKSGVALPAGIGNHRATRQKRSDVVGFPHAVGITALREPPAARRGTSRTQTT